MKFSGDRGVSQMPALELHGSCDQTLFGITPSERLRRQLGYRIEALADVKLVADASTILSDAALDWLIANPHRVLFSRGGNPLAVVLDRAGRVDLGALRAEGTLADAGLSRAEPQELVGLFNRKLRRTQDGLCFSLAEEEAEPVRWALFQDVYKGITDIVTKYAFPVPAYHAVRFCAMARIPPNAVTILSIVLTLVVGKLFYDGAFVSGLAAAWFMTFLDTVDGKLARVTCTSSKFGDKLDHIPDAVHPPLWWICFAVGVTRVDPYAPFIVISSAVILATYMLGRLFEVTFKLIHGFNQYLWRPFDSALRMIIARRNTILVFLTAGVAANDPSAGVDMAAAWSIVTIAVQAWRFLSASLAAKTGQSPLPWMQQA